MKSWQEKAIDKQKERRPGMDTFLHISELNANEWDQERERVEKVVANGEAVVLAQDANGHVFIGYYR